LGIYVIFWEKMELKVEEKWNVGVPALVQLSSSIIY